MNDNNKICGSFPKDSLVNLVVLFSIIYVTPNYFGNFRCTKNHSLARRKFWAARTIEDHQQKSSLRLQERSVTWKLGGLFGAPTVLEQKQRYSSAFKYSFQWAGYVYKVTLGILIPNFLPQHMSTFHHTNSFCSTITAL